MKACELLIFDLDGTLVPTMDGFARIAAAVIAERWGWDVDDARRAYLATSGAPFFEQLEMLFPGDQANEDAARDFERRKARYFYDVRMRPTVRRALWYLRERGMQLAVSSNNFEPLVRSMIDREAPGLFAAVCGYRVGFSKGPEHFTWLQRRFGVTGEQCLFIGDSLSDLEKAHAAGMDFIGVTGTFAEESFLELDPAVATVSSAAELPALLARPSRTAVELDAAV